MSAPDLEDYPPRALPVGVPPSIGFDYDAVEAGLSARPEADPEGVGIIEGLCSWLFRSERDECRPGCIARRIGLRMIALQWAMRPDGLPWARGKALSEREVARDLRVSLSAFNRAAAAVTRETGIRNVFQSHDWRAARRGRGARRPMSGKGKGVRT